MDRRLEMQEAARGHWEMMANADAEPSDLDDFGFNNSLNYVLSTGQIFVQSHFVVMPQAGGWDDQDAAWCDDMLIYLRGLARKKWEYIQSKSESGDKSDVNTQESDEETPDWTAYA
jgi:hypothetical protein